MNERILELAKQAGLKFSSETAMSPVELKFAKLIIGHATECVRDVLRDENSDLSYEAASQVQNRIREYFGLNE
jgi:uncharacterized protein with HEPN domain